MAADIYTSLLFEFIRSKSEDYFTQLQELRERASKILTGIHSTFGHYPSHGLDHSDEIIRAMSSILFVEGNISKPVVKDFNEVEAAILVAAAYTHDVGMVVTDDEKQKITKSENWKHFLEKNSEVNDLWDEACQHLKKASEEKDDGKRAEELFLASVRQRQIFAEFFRRGHAARSGLLLKLSPEVFGAKFMHDRQFRDAVAKVGESHGLSYSDIENPHVYPEVTIIKGLPVNTRFLSIIMRFGDLLDLRTERTDSFSRGLAKIPESSVPHWDQYEDFTNESITNEKIAFTAGCPTQESYRVLRQWCCWIEEESKRASESMRRSKRHSEWVAPIVKVAPAEGPVGLNDTIVLQPTNGASFEPHDWKFYFNNEQIFERLTRDIYRGDKYAFLRELLQNALDATRARLVSRLNEDDIEIPRLLTDVSSHDRDRFPISVKFYKEKVGDDESFWAIVQDKGIGMDAHIIKNYFLQIGQSFYVTNEFRDEYKFSPTSRFGVGFLSVFGVSDHIEVLTKKANESDGPIKLTLQSPNDYLLIERPDVSVGCGTEIKIRLNDRPDFEEMKDYITNLVGRSEFPVQVHLEEDVCTLEPTILMEESIPVRDVKGRYSEECTFDFVVFNLKNDCELGQLGIWYLNENGKRHLNYYSETLSDSIKYSDFGYSSRFYFHGVSHHRYNYRSGVPNRFCFWVDYRGADSKVDLSREGGDLEFGLVIDKIHAELKSELNENKYGMRELHLVMSNFPEIGKLEGLEKLPLIQGYINNAPQEVSLDEMNEVNEFYLVDYDSYMSETYEERLEKEKKFYEGVDLDGELVLFSSDLSVSMREISGVWMEEFFPVSVQVFGERFSKNTSLIKYSRNPKDNWRFQAVEDSRYFKVRCPKYTKRYFESCEVINTLHPCGEWLHKVVNNENLGANDSNVISSALNIESCDVKSILSLGALRLLSEEMAAPESLDKYWAEF